MFIPTNDGAGVPEPNKFDIPGRCQTVIREELENCIELLIVTALLACDKHDFLTERFSITEFAAMLRIQSSPPIIFITSRNQTLQVILPIKFNLNNR